LAKELASEVGLCVRRGQRQPGRTPLRTPELWHRREPRSTALMWKNINISTVQGMDAEALAY